MGNTNRKAIKPTYLSGDERAYVVSKFVRDITKQYQSLNIPIEIQQIIYHFCDQLVTVQYAPFTKRDTDSQIKQQPEVMKLLMSGAHGWFNSGVGKSCLILRYVDDEFQESYISTIGIDFKLRTVKVNQKYIKLKIWDESQGREKFRTITSAYYRGAHGILIVFDITSRETFAAVREPLLTVERHSNENHCKILVGNKLDLIDKRVVSFEEADALAKEYNMKYIEVSAKTGENVNAAFETLIIEIYKKKIPLWKISKPSSSNIHKIKLNENSNKNECVLL
eukprot:530178_1